MEKRTFTLDNEHPEIIVKNILFVSEIVPCDAQIAMTIFAVLFWCGKM